MKRIKQTAVLLSLLILAGGGLMFADDDAPRAGFGLRASAFGVPDQVLDLFIYEHPQVRGQSYALELRSYGRKGPRSVFSGVYSLEYSKMDGEGPWRDEEGHRTLVGSGEVTQWSFTATVLMNIFPSLPVHPYLGAGIGIGKISIWYEGSYTDEVGTQITDRYEEDRIIPVVHVPIGIAINIRDRFEVRIEGGFKNGFYAGAGLSVNF